MKKYQKLLMNMLSRKSFKMTKIWKDFFNMFFYLGMD